MKLKVMAVVVAIAVLIGAAAIAGDAAPTKPAPSSAQVSQQELLARRLDAIRRATVDCQNIKCLNRQLTKLSNFVDFFYGCILVFPVSQYGDAGGTQGYVYDPGGGGGSFDTTALDYTVDTGTDAYRYMATFKKPCVN